MPLFAQQRPSGPFTKLTPRFRCSHGAGGAVRAADHALLTGRFTRALDSYLSILADHPRDGELCDRVLHARTAEAALAARCPGIAHDLAVAAVRRGSGSPIGAEAVLTARSLVLQARAHLTSGRTEAAAFTLRRAQSTIHRDPAVHGLVQLSAAEIHLAQENPGDDLDSAVDLVATMMSRHRLNASQGTVPAVLISLGRSLVHSGRIGLAAQVFDLAAQQTGVTGWIGRYGVDALGERKPEADARWQYAVAQWTEALSEEAHCHAAMPSTSSDSESLLVYRLAAASAANCGDAETAARLAVCAEYLRGRAGTGHGEWTVPREPEANFLFLFADRAAQRRWAALHEGVRAIGVASTGMAPSVAEPSEQPAQEDPQKFAWWVGRSDPERLREAARSADDVFSRLQASAPATFGALYSTVGRTISALHALLGDGSPDAAQQGVTMAARATTRQTGADAHIGRDLSGFPAVVSPYKDAVTTVPVVERPQPGALHRSPWFDEEVRQSAERCWTALTAAAEAHRLGQSHVGSEHLLLAVSEDSACAALLRPLGIGPEAVRRCVTGLTAPDPRQGGAAPPTARASALLALARTQARDQGVDRVSPVHVLGALVLEGRSVGAHLLTALGADRAELLARLRDHSGRHDRAVLPPPSIEGLPPLRRCTAATRRAVARAGRWAAASPSGLLDRALLLRALAAEDWTSDERPAVEGDDLVPPTASLARIDAAQSSVHSTGSARFQVRATPVVRRILLAACAEAAQRGHPGLDVDLLTRFALQDRTHAAAGGVTNEAAPALDGDARAVLDAAGAAAIADSVPYIGPEHIAAALGHDGDRPSPAIGDRHLRGTEEPYPAVPLPLTPYAAEVLAEAVARARSAPRTTVTKADLAGALADISPAVEPPDTGAQSPGAAENPQGQRFHTHLVRLLERALDRIGERTTQLLKLGHSEDGDEDEHDARLRELEDVRDERVEVLRLLCRQGADRYEALLIEDLTASARRRPGTFAVSALEEATDRTRRAGPPNREGARATVRNLTEIAGVHQLAGRVRTALSLYDEALVRLAAAPGTPDGKDRETEAELRGWTLQQRARCLAADGPEAETAALLLACDHQCGRLEEASSAPHHGQLMTTVEGMAKRLADIGRHDKALVVTSRAIRAGVSRGTELAAVHAERSRALWALNRGDLGRADLDSAVRLAPQDPYYATGRGTHLMWTGRLGAAIADFDRALELAPASLLARHRRGEAHLRAGRHAEALSDLDVIHQREPVATAALLTRGRALRALGDAKAALRDLTAANAADPECSWTRYQYAITLAATGSVDRARRQLGAAIRQESADYRVLTPWRFTCAANLAVYHAALGAGPQALRWLRTAANYRHRPWMVAELHDDLAELSRTLPELTVLCEELSLFPSQGAAW
ncbi:tetratricopeptide repeat protein [Streptomyces cyaneofuscatus]|uniref:tetratricopeptide repeat protein n=1 Tax=Streptomyces cyaneofuscatus TaxID=66883 RepID=UPI0036743C97